MTEEVSGDSRGDGSLMPGVNGDVRARSRPSPRGELGMGMVERVVGEIPSTLLLTDDVRSVSRQVSLRALAFRHGGPCVQSNRS